MGYTHYWNQKRNFKLDEWSEIKDGVFELLRIARGFGAQLGGPEGEGGPVTITTDVLALNGVGDHAFESFVITRKRHPDDSWFCKTGREPYDVAVTAILALLDSLYPDALSASSNGRIADWIAGVELARQAWPSKANQIDVPRAVRDYDRYESYLDNSKQFLVAVDWQGRLLVERIKDRMRVALPEGWRTLEGSRDRAYSEWVRTVPHNQRKYGSFRGDHETCAANRMRAFWKIANRAVSASRQGHEPIPDYVFETGEEARPAPDGLAPPPFTEPGAPRYAAFAQGHRDYHAGVTDNPHPLWLSAAYDWQTGQKYAAAGVTLKELPEAIISLQAGEDGFTVSDTADDKPETFETHAAAVEEVERRLRWFAFDGRLARLGVEQAAA